MQHEACAQRNRLDCVYLTTLRRNANSGAPLRVTVVLIILMIQLIPGQFSLMCSGASYRFAEACG